MKTHIAEVIDVIKGKGIPEYRVRLPDGNIIIIPHTIIQPDRATLLVKGSRLLVIHELGNVEKATTDLEYELSGNIDAIQKINGVGWYRVELSQGGTIKIEQKMVTPHPTNRPIIIDAELRIHFIDHEIIEAKLIRETDLAKVRKIDLIKGTVNVRGNHGDDYTVRLETAVLRQLLVGEVLIMEVNFSPEGKRKILLSRQEEKRPPAKSSPAPAQPPKDGVKNEPQQGVVASPVKPTVEEPFAEETAGPARTIAEEAEALGIDPIELERIKREGHRYEIVSFLDRHARDGLIEWYRLKENRPPRFTQPQRPLDPVLNASIREATPGFQDFYYHQAKALDGIRADRNQIIVTQTASGKTLGYNPAIFEYLLSNPNGHVLYIFPLNALMMDQVDKVTDLIAELEKAGEHITAKYLRGGMNEGERDLIARNPPNILITNPEMLSFIVGFADKYWRSFFSNLKYIVIDEVHTYRGIFGVHMTGIVRRLLFAAKSLGSDPRFILSSATVSNPKDLAARLTSLPEDAFDLLGPEQDGSQQAFKHWLLLNSDWEAAGERFENYQEVAAAVFVEMLTCRDAVGKPAPLNTILFCRSIKEVKSISRLVQQFIAQKAPQLQQKIKTYVSAELTIGAKTEIYNGLRSGDYLGVISTNALEAGIDIGRLDACVIAGFPFSVMTLRQMAGRVGRQNEGVVMFIPFPLSSLDQYYRDHPDLLLEQPPEVFVVDPNNSYIARKHINSAAYPNGIGTDDLRRYWGDQAVEIAQKAVNDQAMRFWNNTWYGSRRNYQDPDDVYAVNNIRSNAQIPYAVCPNELKNCEVGQECFDQSGKGCKNRITLLDRQYVYRDAHPQAIFESTDHQLYRIISLDEKSRIVRAEALQENDKRRTFVEADVAIMINGQPRGEKTLLSGIKMAWGDVTVTKLFTGYYSYFLKPARRCRKCHREYGETDTRCPTCQRPTELFYNQSKPERQDFSPPFENGFQIPLNTIACWLMIPAETEERLVESSPCPLPGEKNKVLAWLKKPLEFNRIPARVNITESEKAIITRYHQQAAEQVKKYRPTVQETLLYPGIYGQCILSALRKELPESRALELYQALIGYPVTDDLRHICRQCQRSVLLPAMHTLEHAVDARYPSVALGDRSDIGAYTTLGYATTGMPTIFWWDNYDGGLGAAEKIYELIERLLNVGFNTLNDCGCTTLEGCPRCTFIPDCAEGNENLNKPAGMHLITHILGKTGAQASNPFIYRRKKSEKFNQKYEENEISSSVRGVKEEAPVKPQVDPYQLLRLQQELHEAVLKKAFEVRSREISQEDPPISAVEINQAYQEALKRKLLKEWQLHQNVSPYQILEVLPSASLKMIQQIYRIIAMQVHPDFNPQNAALANELMKEVNAAYQQVFESRSKG